MGNVQAALAIKDNVTKSIETKRLRLTAKAKISAYQLHNHRAKATVQNPIALFHFSANYLPEIIGFVAVKTFISFSKREICRTTYNL